MKGEMMGRYKYPRGYHPNSLKALEEGRKKNQFTPRAGKEARAKGVMLRKILKDAVEIAYSTTDPEEWDALCRRVARAVVDAAKAGDLYALKLLMRYM